MCFIGFNSKNIFNIFYVINVINVLKHFFFISGCFTRRLFNNTKKTNILRLKFFNYLKTTLIIFYFNIAINIFIKLVLCV